MTYDDSFDQARLDQLADQHLGSISLTGRILFFGDADENRLDLATWQFDNDDDYEVVKGSDFKLHMMELLKPSEINRGGFYPVRIFST